MNATTLTLIALVMTSGAAFAHADAAPASVVLNQPTSIDYSSAASLAQTISATNAHERALIVQTRADNR